MKNALAALAIVTVAGVAASANAGLRNTTLPIDSQPYTGPNFRGPFSTGFEAGDGYVQGTIAGQQGWVIRNFDAFGPTPGTAVITNGVNAGNGSGNALRLSDGPQTNGNLVPAQLSGLGTGNTRFSIDVKIDDDFGADYGVIGINTALGGTNTFRVQFSYTGTIEYNNNGVFTDTGIRWSRGVYSNLTVQINTNSIQYFYDGELIIAQPSLNAGGNNFDRLWLTHNSFQESGNGPITGTIAAAYFDNITITPTPGAIAVLGLGGLVAGRRRRA